jgi:uncharacterized protein YecE (DUF72 family)
MQRTGTAGWSLPAKETAEGTRLQRYSRTLPCVEINSTFHRPHRATTWARWATETPAGFRFSIKAPKTITHEAKLLDSQSLIRSFLQQIEPLQGKAGPILFQLPPSLAFDAAVAESFLGAWRELYSRETVLEPRHESWFIPPVDTLLRKYSIARVAADPPKGSPQAAEPGGNLDLVYYRLHGSPRTYYSNYEDEFLATLAARIRLDKNVWVIFDNTALSHAYPNALSLQRLTQKASVESTNPPLEDSRR